MKRFGVAFLVLLVLFSWGSVSVCIGEDELDAKLQEIFRSSLDMPEVPMNGDAIDTIDSIYSDFLHAMELYGEGNYSETPDLFLEVADRAGNMNAWLEYLYDNAQDRSYSINHKMDDIQKVSVLRAGQAYNRSSYTMEATQCFRALIENAESEGWGSKNDDVLNTAISELLAFVSDTSIESMYYGYEDRVSVYNAIQSIVPDSYSIEVYLDGNRCYGYEGARCTVSSSDEMTFSWNHLEGTIGSYYVEFEPEIDVIPITMNSSDLELYSGISQYAQKEIIPITISDGVASFKINKSAFAADQEYKMKIAAIPEKGYIYAAIMMQDAYFRIGLDADDMPDVQIQCFGYLEYPDGSLYVVDPKHAIFSWTQIPTVEEYRVCIKENDEVVLDLGTTSSTAQIVDFDTLEAGKEYTMYVGAIPHGGTEDSAKWGSISFMLEDDPMEKWVVDGISIPQITIDNAQMDENNVAYVTGDTVTFRWSSTGYLSSYDIHITNSKGEKREFGESTKTSIWLDASIFAEDGPFTIFVGAIPAGKTKENAVWGGLTFVLGEMPVEQSASSTGLANECEPEITINGILFNGNTLPVCGDSVTISWNAEGNVESYYFEAYNPDGSMAISTGATNNKVITSSTAGMVAGEIYSVRVGAMPTGGREADIQWSEATFMLADEENSPYIMVEGYDSIDGDVYIIREDSFRIIWGAAGDVQSYILKETRDSTGDSRSNSTTDTSVTMNASDYPTGETFTMQVGVIPTNGTEENAQWSSVQYKIAEKAPEIGTVSAPVITVEGYESVDGSVYVIGGDSFRISWSAEGDVQSYILKETRDSTGDSRSNSTTDTSITLDATSYPKGETFTMRVGVIPVGGTETDAKWRYVQYKIAENG